jgi:hypothetical protein
MVRNSATNRIGFPRPLMWPIALTSLRVPVANRILPDDRDHSLPRVIGDGFVPVLVATIATASAVLFALD